MSDNKPANGAIEAEHVPLKEELDELKREMRSAQWTDWIQKNRTPLTIVTGVVIAGLVVTGFLIEQNRAQRGDAATVYEQAMGASEDKTRLTLLKQVISDYADSTYGAMAEFQLAAIDREHAIQHLKAVVAHPKSMPEWVWQARLDLAEASLQAGDKAAARNYLSGEFGTHYQQQRHYLMAMAAENEAEKQQHLQQALDAVSHDETLRAKIQSLLAQKDS